jgi:hypothetical protein
MWAAAFRLSRETKHSDGPIAKDARAAKFEEVHLFIAKSDLPFIRNVDVL